MARANVPLLAFNRGLISPLALGRVDVDRTRLSAALMTNWLPKTQGPMTIRPGTKHVGSSLNDTGAEYIEFVAATDDVALPEITTNKMRVWLGSDAHALSLLGRPAVDTVLTLSDTGWEDASTGGSVSLGGTDLIPTMTSGTTNGVTISASNEDLPAWKAGDDDLGTRWQLVGGLPGQWQVDFGAGNTALVRSYSLRAPDAAGRLNEMPRDWTLERSANGSSWTTEDTRSGETGWGVSEKRTYGAQNDTGTSAVRYWRLNVSANDGGNAGELNIAEVELFPQEAAGQVKFQSGVLTLNASAIGSLAKATKRVVVSDTGTEHALNIYVSRGPVTFRCGSTAGDDDYISETRLGTGYHNLAFTPNGIYFHITVQSDALVDRIVGTLAISDTGTVELTAPWGQSDLGNIRYDQSADVVYIDCADVRPQKVERRGTGRSWSVVNYEPDFGPFLPTATTAAKLQVAKVYGNTTLHSDIPLFTSGHVGALFRIFHRGQSGTWLLGDSGAVTDAIAVDGITDTGLLLPFGDTGNYNAHERVIQFQTSGTFTATLRIQRSFDGPDIGFHNIDTGAAISSGTTKLTSATTVRIVDPDDNTKVWYRAFLEAYTSGVVQVDVTYPGGGVTGVGRVTSYVDNQEVNFEVLRRFSATTASDNWQEGYWSTKRGYPSAVRFHEGRLFHAGGASFFGSVSDDFENFDDTTTGESAPIIRTLGSGPVDNVHHMLSLERLIAGTAGRDIALRASSLDEPLTATNATAKAFSTQGSANLRALQIDSYGVFVQRSGQRAYLISFSGGVTRDFEADELTLMVPDLLSAGVVSIAAQQQPDTRVHFVLADGKVAILTLLKAEEIACWSLWETDGTVERAMVLPGSGEDAVYYHVNRTVNNATKRFLEKWALESECRGDTGLSWLADCAASYSDPGRRGDTGDIAGWSHLIGENLVAWCNDTGDGIRDLSPDTGGTDFSQTLHTVDTGGNIAPATLVHHVVAGLPYTADWRSTKMAYAAVLGTALTQLKRVDKIGMVLHRVHNNGLYYGRDTGDLDPLPRLSDEGEAVGANKVFGSLDQVQVALPGRWDSDARVYLRGKAPRPVTVLAAVPSVTTNEK